jgi:LmbE family N-acetylglucosaminyl deacetylase
MRAAQIAGSIPVADCGELAGVDAFNVGEGAVVKVVDADRAYAEVSGIVLGSRNSPTQVRKTLIHMTDGGASTDLIARDELVTMRKRECLDAARVLGVTNTIFLEYADTKLWDNISPATERVAEILERERPGQVFVPYRHEPTRQAADHVAATKIVLAAVERVGRPVVVWEYPIWAWLHWPWVRLRQPGPLMRTKHLLWNSGLLLFGMRPLLDWRRHVDIGDVLEEKRTAIAQHRSQTERIIAHPGYMTLDDVCHGEFVEWFLQDREYFRVYDFPGRR